LISSINTLKQNIDTSHTHPRAQHLRLKFARATKSRSRSEGRPRDAQRFLLGYMHQVDPDTSVTKESDSDDSA